jgi:hypothetical protein
MQFHGDWRAGGRRRPAPKMSKVSVCVIVGLLAYIAAKLAGAPL